ncbi:MAG: hypothetical protein QXL35_05475 [Candidatus Bathyarchaeia archaeon]
MRSKDKEREVKITDLAGSWRMSDEEWARVRESLREAWKRWGPLEIRP